MPAEDIKEKLEEIHNRDGRDKEGILKTAIELFELLTVYLREQASSIVYDSFFGPLEAFKKNFMRGIISAFVFGIAAIFLAVGVLFLLTMFVAAWIVYISIGVVLLIIGLSLNRKAK